MMRCWFDFEKSKLENITDLSVEVLLNGSGTWEEWHEKLHIKILFLWKWFYWVIKYLYIYYKVYKTWNNK